MTTRGLPMACSVAIMVLAAASGWAAEGEERATTRTRVDTRPGRLEERLSALERRLAERRAEAGPELRRDRPEDLRLVYARVYLDMARLMLRSGGAAAAAMAERAEHLLPAAPADADEQR